MTDLLPRLLVDSGCGGGIYRLILKKHHQKKGERRKPERTLWFYYMIGKYDVPLGIVLCKAKYKQISVICI